MGIPAKVRREKNKIDLIELSAHRYYRQQNTKKINKRLQFLNHCLKNRRFIKFSEINPRLHQ